MSARQLALPVAVLIGLSAFTADQIASILGLRAALATSAQERAAQTKPLESAQRIERQLDALASGTVGLASGGDPVAQRIASAMQASGIELRSHQDGPKT